MPLLYLKFCLKNKHIPYYRELECPPIAHECIFARSLDLNHLAVTSKFLRIQTLPVFAFLVISVVIEVETQPSLL